MIERPNSGLFVESAVCEFRRSNSGCNGLWNCDMGRGIIM